MAKKIGCGFVLICIFIFLVIIFTWKRATIFKTAYLSRRDNNFIITIRGRGVGHPDGLGDVFFPNTYPDSIQYVIPRDIGEIKGEELPRLSGYYKSTGTIIITRNKIKVSLYYENTDQKKLDAGTWNGDYDLVKIK